MPITPLSTADILQENTGQASDAASADVVLAGGQVTVAGSSVLVMIHHGDAITTPGGWTLDYGVGSDALGRVSFFRKTGVADESSWTFSAVSGTTSWQWTVLEVARLAVSPVHKTTNATYAGTDATIDSSTGGSVVRNDCLMLGAFTLKTSVSQATLSGLTLARNDATNMVRWTQIADQRWATDGSVNYLAVPFRYLTYPKGGTVTARATLAGNSSLSSDSWLTAEVLYASAEAGQPDPLVYATGWEHGVTPNTASPTTNRRMVDATAGTWGTNFLVQGSSARNGNYGLRIVQSGAAAYQRWTTDTVGTSKDDCVVGVNVKVVSATTDPSVLLEITPANGDAVQLIYDPSTTQLGLRWGSGGTPAWQTGTTATGTWAWVDIMADGLNATSRSARWACEENGVVVEQPAPADLTGQTIGGLLHVAVGGNVAQTVTADFDDLCISTFAGDYRLGKHKVVLVGPDPSGTPTVSGAGGTAAFNTFAGNTTLSAWNAATARDALDEVPVNISTTADGLVQITTASTTWATIPLATYTLAPGERVSYVGAVVALWANSGQNATLQLNGSCAGGGTVWLSAAGAFNPGNEAQPASSTVPTWIRGKWTLSGSAGFQQADLDSMELEVGRSTDAAPDIGIHNAHVEVAVMLADAGPLFGETAAALRVEVDADQLSTSPYELRAYTPAGQTATLRYEVAGVVVSEAVPAAANPYIVTVAADDAPAVTRIEFEPDG
jgi:hypothetical protein